LANRSRRVCGDQDLEGIRASSSDLPGFYHQQHDPAHERQRADDRRDEMVVSGGDVQAKEIDRLAGGLKRDARLSEHHNAESYKEDSDDGFGIHNNILVWFLGRV